MSQTEFVVNILAILVSPVVAVVVSIWIQQRKEDRSRKERLFLTLMSHRRANPPRAEYVDALNQIDVVFHDEPKVLQLWHDYYDLLGPSNFMNEWQKREHKFLEMLSAMSQHLGIKNLKQTDIDKYYWPTAFSRSLEAQEKLSTEWLRVLERSESVGPIRSIDDSEEQ